MVLAVISYDRYQHVNFNYTCSVSNRPTPPVERQSISEYEDDLIDEKTNKKGE